MYKMFKKLLQKLKKTGKKVGGSKEGWRKGDKYDYILQTVSIKYMKYVIFILVKKLGIIYRHSCVRSFFLHIHTNAVAISFLPNSLPLSSHNKKRPKQGKEMLLRSARSTVAEPVNPECLNGSNCLSKCLEA